MSNETIRGNLVDAINELNKLLEVCNDENQKFAIRIKIRELYQRLDRVVVATLDSTTPEFADAITALKSVTGMAIEAKENIDKVADVINKVAEAIGKVEGLVKNVAGVLTII